MTERWEEASHQEAARRHHRTSEPGTGSDSIPIPAHENVFTRPRSAAPRVRGAESVSPVKIRSRSQKVAERDRLREEVTLELLEKTQDKDIKTTFKVRRAHVPSGMIIVFNFCKNCWSLGF